MKNISYKAAGVLQTRHKANRGSEFEDEGDLNYYTTFYRKYDAQIGRFTGVDMLAEKFMLINPYQFGGNNPIMFNDPTGDQPSPRNPYGKFLMQKGPDGNYHNDWRNEQLWNEIGFYRGEMGGYYFSASGVSSEDVMQQIGLGNKIVKSKISGRFGFWMQSNFDPLNNIEGSLEAVGIIVKWTSLDNISSGVSRIVQATIPFFNINLMQTGGREDYLRGGRTTDRDRNIKRYPESFQRWYHREYKPDVHPGRDATPEELKQVHKDWEEMGKPVVKATALAAVAWGLWEGFKWTAAILLAPETGGLSLEAAAAIP